MNDKIIGLVVLIGLPGAGKTTFAEFLKQNLESASDIEGRKSLPPHVLHVCYDKLLHFPTTRNESSIEWYNARKNVLNKVEKFVNGLREGSVSDQSFEFMESKTDFYKYQRFLVVIDDNMYYRSMRYQYYQLARTYSLGFSQVFIHCELDKVMQRNAARNRENFVPEEVITRMNDRLEPPNTVNTWEQYSCFVSSLDPFDATMVHKVCNVILESMTHPVLPHPDDAEAVQTSRIACLTNVIHQADLTLRKIISQYLSNQSAALDKHNLKTLAKSCHTKKQIILQQLTKGMIIIPEEICFHIEACSSEASSLLYEYLQDIFEKTFNN